MQPGDVPVTYADTKALEEDFGFKPNTSLRDGLRKFAEWYKEFICSTNIGKGSQRMTSLWNLISLKYLLYIPYLSHHPDRSRTCWQ